MTETSSWDAAVGSHPTRRWRQVALPTEHGGWSLTAEPVVLGLVVASSWPGLALGVAAMVAFLARTPLKLVLVDRWRHRWLDRTALAARIAAVEVAVIVVLGVVAVIGASDGWFLVPLAAALPLIVVELWFDMRSRGRRLVPELAGTVGIGSVVAAIVLVADEPVSLALGLWVVVSARAVAGISYARTQVLRAHDRPVTLWHSDLAQLLAVAAVVTAWALEAIPPVAVAVIAVIAAFDVVAVRAAAQRAVVIGIQQVIFGITVVVVTATGVLA